MPPLRHASFVVVMLVALQVHASEPTVKQEDLPRIPATELKDAPATFGVRPDFQIQLVAGEPRVIDPIAICFDENGRMFVVEMRDYSERREEKLGRIRMLEDTDGDGVFEKSTVFLENLPWPTAVMYVNGGVLIGACPDIIFAKDTTGDGVADESKVLFTGFGTKERLNVQGLFNNFQWGLDNRIHGCSGTVGGSVTQAIHPDAPPIDVRGKGFVIDPRDWSMTTEAGGGQYGLSYDHTGRLFTCSNSIHIELLLYDAKYAARNPYVTLPDPRICIAADGPAAEVFRFSPEEPWRVIRTRWRVAGLVGGPIEGGGRSAGYFTGATGLTIYRGDAFGPEYVGDAFVGDAGGNLVHHKRLRPGPDGIQPIAERPTDERTTEFCASRDNWFRPVDFANTPDGSLFICDMYRETIEHPWSLPPQIKQFLDLNSGNDRGRIWRLAPLGFKPRPPPRLGSASITELVAMLGHENGWHRETASRLLFERRDRSCDSVLEATVAASDRPLERLAALHVLDGLSALSEATLLTAMDDKDGTVRAHAVKLSEKLVRDGIVSDAVWAKYLVLADDKEPLVAFQLAFTVGNTKHPELASLLNRLAVRDPPSAWMRTAVVSSAANVGAPLFASLIDRTDARPTANLLAEMIGAKGDQGEIEQAATSVAGLPAGNDAFNLARSLLEGADRSGGAAAAQTALAGVLDRAADVSRATQKPVRERATAASLLRFTPGGAGILLALLADKSETIRLTALAGLDRLDAPQLPDAIVTHFQSFSTRVKSESITLLLKRPARAEALVRAIETGAMPSTALDASQIAFLHAHANPSVRELSRRVLEPPATREQVIEQFKSALSLTGVPANGKLRYQKLCISCHRADAEGYSVGPDLVSVRNSGKEKLLYSILDPNREVAPNYVSYLIETKSGESVLGVLASDTPAAIVIREAYGKETVIPRANIKKMSSQGRTLMPEGLETGLQPQDLADLISFVESVK